MKIFNFALITLFSSSVLLANNNVKKNDEENIVSTGLVAYSASYSSSYKDEPNYSTQNTKTFQYLNLGSTLDSYRGDSVKVGIIDSGLNYDHEDLLDSSGNTKMNGASKYYAYNSTKKQWQYYQASTHGYSYLDDSLGHGTNVASAVASAINGIGGLGIAPNVELYIFKVTNESNGYEFGAIQCALLEAVNLGLDVVNMSFQSYEQAVSYNSSSMAASTGCSTTLTTYLNKAYNAGITLVAAAGNYNTSAPSYPGSNAHVINVGSLSSDGTTKAPFSNYGSTIDIVAPGYVNVASKTSNSSYTNTQGTSFSAPLVTGAIALYKQKNPDATPDEIEAALYASCDPIDDSSSSYSNWAGNGALNISKFLEMDIVPTKVTLSSVDTFISSGKTMQIHALVLPENAGNKNVTWSSSNPSVGTIDSNGLFTALSEGKTTITATTVEGGVTGTLEVTVKPAISNVTYLPNPINLTVGDTLQLQKQMTYSDGSTEIVDCNSEIDLFDIKDTSIATVDENGVITAVKKGTTQIYIYGDGEELIDIVVSEKTVAPTAISLSGAASIQIGKTTQLSATFTPENTTETGIEWTSSDKAIATVSSTGLVTGVSSGTVKITAKSTYLSSISAEITIEVTSLDNVEQWTLATSDTTLIAGDKIIFTYGSDIVSGALGANKYLAKTSCTIVDNHITELKNDAVGYTLEKGTSTNAFKLLSSEGYLNYSSDNLTKSDKSGLDWIISFNASNEALVKAGTTSNYLRYNTGSPRFKPYSSTTCSPIKIYYARTSTGDFPIVDEIATPVESVALSETSKTIDLSAKSFTLTATVLPESATNKNVSWSSSDTTVATVDNGVVSLKKVGTTTITVTTESGAKTASCSLIVVDGSIVESVTLNKASAELSLGGTLQLTATVLPEYALDKTVEWTSDNESIAIVSSTGLVTAKSLGKATITATTKTGGKSASCSITVVEDLTPTSIVFKTSSSDSSATLTSSTLKDHIKSGKDLISDQNISITKVFGASKQGLKFGSSNSGGSLTFDASDKLKAKLTSSITFVTGAYGSDSNSMTAKITFSDDSTLEISITAGTNKTETFSSPKNIKSINVTSSNRAYLTSISFEYAKASTYTATQFAQDFIDNVICDATGNSSPTLNKTWSELKALYETLSVSEKEILISATYSISGSGDSTVITGTNSTDDLVAQAMFRYDYIVAKYGNEAFISGRTNSLVNIVIPAINPIDLSMATPLIVIIMLISVSSIAMLVINHKKED